MGGTSTVVLTRSRSIACSTPSGENDGSVTCVPPTAQSMLSRMMSAMWNIGATCRPIEPSRAMPSATANRLFWPRPSCESITPLGTPVVPPVSKTPAKSEPPRRASGTGSVSANSVS
jgi:hypothetical protein